MDTNGPGSHSKCQFKWGNFAKITASSAAVWAHRLETYRKLHGSLSTHCRKECEIECQNRCQKECQNICRKKCQIECQGLCQKVCQECQLCLGTDGPKPHGKLQISLGTHGPRPERLPNKLPDRTPEYLPERVPDRMSMFFPHLPGEGCQILCQPARLLLPPSSFLLPPFLPGRQLQALDRSVPRQTLTATSGSKCSPPDLHRKLRIKVFPAGPPPQAPDQSVARRTSTTKNLRRYNIPDRMPDRIDCHKMCEIKM